MAQTWLAAAEETLKANRERLLAQLHQDVQALDPAPSAGALRAAAKIVATINLDSGRHLVPVWGSNENAVIAIAKIIDRETSTSAQSAPTEEEVEAQAAEYARAKYGGA